MKEKKWADLMEEEEGEIGRDLHKNERKKVGRFNGGRRG
jgi:hypothetical protein